MENSAIFSEDNKVALQACRICSRTFHPDSLERHEKICEKTKTKPRKVFNSCQQRLKDVVHDAARSVKQDEKRKTKSNWKAQHEELLRTVRSEKIETPFLERGRPQQKVIPLGYLQCPVCRRCFNHKAADRHISWCQAQLSRLPKSPPSSEAIMRLKARTQYRAPVPSRKRYSLEDSRRLIKSAESTCKSAFSALRTHSSPCTSSLMRHSQRQVEFQLPNGSRTRRKSCERSTFSREYDDEEMFSVSNAMPVRSRSFHKISPSRETPIKFKEKFPQYGNSRKLSSNNNHRNQNQRLVYGEDAITRNDHYDLLSALRLQMAELQLVDSGGSNGNCHLPNLSKSAELSPSKCDVLVVNASPKHSPRLPRFCYHCGTRYPVQSAKYCCECGAKRLVLNDNMT